MASMSQIADFLSKGGYRTNPTRKTQRRNPAVQPLSQADIDILLAGGFERSNPARKRKNGAQPLDIKQLPQEIKRLEDTALGESLAAEAVDGLSDPKSRLQRICSVERQPSKLTTYTDDQEQFEWVGLKGRMLCVDAAHIIPNRLHSYDKDLICGVALAPIHPKAIMPIPMRAPIVAIEIPKDSTQGFAIIDAQAAPLIGAILSGVDSVCVEISSDLYKRYSTWLRSNRPTGAKDILLMRYLDDNLI